jgi:hypothetical protein
MSQQNNNIDWVYCFKRGSKFVYLNRWDQTISIFNTYQDAAQFANANPNLINQKIKNDNRNKKARQAA